MSATGTDKLKRLLIQNLMDDFNDSDQYYYIGIGRSRDWNDSDTAPTPKNSVRDARNAALDLQSIKIVGDASFVVPRNNWTSGVVYSGWDDDTEDYPAQKYYVMTSSNQVYLCVQGGRDATGTPVASTVEPSGTSTSHFRTADGYTWKFLYSVSTSKSAKFLTSGYIPIQVIETPDSDNIFEVEQHNVRKNAVGGQIGSIAVTSGGSGYSSVPSVSIVGNGTGATATAYVSGGAVTKIEVDSDGHGSGYDYANVVISGGGGSGASARAIIGHQNGFGYNPLVDLKATSLMFNVKPDGTEGGNFIVGQNFRQVVLLKNPKTSSDSDFTNNSGSTLKKITFSSITNDFSPDKTFVGGTSGTKGFVDFYEDSSGGEYLLYHQDETTGFGSFTIGETITESDGVGEGVIATDSDGDVNPTGFDVLYIDNRGKIERSSNQTEDIKAIISL